MTRNTAARLLTSLALAISAAACTTPPYDYSQSDTINYPIDMVIEQRETAEYEARQAEIERTRDEQHEMFLER